MAQFHAIGRRKTSVARVYMSEGTGSMTINGKDYKNYFNTAPLHFKLEQPFSATEKQ
jgi:small subunit ribosomal protein S9